jgi:GTPase Era involved in 16S rRNA processing
MQKNDNFSVAVIATMSSGKSTTLNAMLGVPLLPSKNEACTATVCKIEDIDGMNNFKARVIKTNGETTKWENIKCEDRKLDEWNNSTVKTIEIQGDFPHIDNHKKKILFFDTPGPNNSTDKSHSEITKNILSNSDYGFIICVMNASQFGVDDERILLENLLHELNEKGQRTKIVFVVNKVDQLDIEAGEKPIKLINNIKKYLNGIGFNRPNIIPVMSLLSLEIRKILTAKKNEKDLPLSNRKQKRLMRNLDCLFEFKEDYFKASMNTKIKSKYLERAINQERKVNSLHEIELGGQKISIEKLIEADIITGIPLLEEMLEVELLKKSGQYYKK